MSQETLICIICLDDLHMTEDVIDPNIGPLCFDCIRMLEDN